MSVESPLPPSEEPPPDSSALPPDDGGNDQEWLPKVKRRHRRNEAGGEVGEASDREILVLCSLLLTNLLDKRSSIVDEPIESRLKANRLPAKSTLPATPPPPKAVETPPAPPPVAFAASPQIKLRPRTAEGAAGKGHWQTHTLAEKATGFMMAALVVAAFAYFVGRKVIHSPILTHAAVSNQVVGPVPKLTTIWSPALISQLDAVLTADQNGELKTARQLATDLKKRMPESSDLDLYLSTLQVRDGEYSNAEQSISKMLNGFTPPLLAAAINENLGFIYARKRDLPLAISSFADAAAADPFNAVHFYHWGEALRRKGQLQEAVIHLNEALTRLPQGSLAIESLREEVEFKINLTRIELGTDDADLTAAITEHLKTPMPNGYWLLTAAAYALQHGDMATAADDFRKARSTLSADAYTVLTNDSFLRSFAGNDEIAAFLNVGSAASRARLLQPRMGYFIDP